MYYTKAMTTEFRFYHLETTSLERALPQLVNAAYQKGHRVLVKTSDEGSSERLNELLWTFSESAFLPHGNEKDGDPEAQPIWITHTNDNKNNADIAILTDGSTLDDISSYIMTCDMFDGSNDASLQAARERWKGFKDMDDVTLCYYQQDDNGAWNKKA